MGSPVLLLRLEGPLQAWGTRARWDVRDTGPEPTKSGVVGLLGCALGYERGDPRLAALDAGLCFGVRIEAPGQVVEDFQTVTDFLPTAGGEFRVSGGTKSAAALRADPQARPATIVSPRSYLADAAFLVGLHATAAAPDGLLTECAAALRSPRWPLFLGRKCCVPSRPVLDPARDGLTDAYAGLEDALARHPWSWLGGRGQRRSGESPPDTLTAYVEDQTGELTRQDALRLNAARVYGFRAAHRLQVPAAALKGE